MLCGLAAPPPGPRASALPARLRSGGRAAQRDLLLSLVFERPARRPVRPLDPGWPRASLRPGLALLPQPRAVLERGSARAARADARYLRRRGGRGRELLVGPRIPGGLTATGGDACGREARSQGGCPARAVSRAYGGHG